MFKTTKTLTCASVLLATTLLTACSAPAETNTAVVKTETVVAKTAESTPQAALTIVGLAVGSEDLTTLVAAVQAAGLVDTLNSDGPFTVFAPTNAAFAKLPAGTVETLVMPENNAMLSAILTYHVVGADVMAADLIAAINGNDGSYTVPTVNGGTLTASIVDGKVYLTDANGTLSQVIKTDIKASNGVVHLIDTVVMPK